MADVSGGLVFGCTAQSPVSFPGLLHSIEGVESRYFGFAVKILLLTLVDRRSEGLPLAVIDLFLGEVYLKLRLLSELLLCADRKIFFEVLEVCVISV